MEQRLPELTHQQLINIKSLDLARLCGLAATRAGRPSGVALEEEFAARWPRSPNLSAIRAHLTKTAVVAGSTTGASWASSLIPTSLFRALIDFASAYDLLARLLVLGAQRAPFLAKIPYSTTALTSAAWRGEGAPKVALRHSSTSTSLTPLVLAGFSVLTDELVRFSEPGADVFVRDLLAREITRFPNAHFCSTTAAVANVSPAGALNGLTPINASTDPATDIRELTTAYVAGGGRIESAVVLVSSQNAIALRLTGNTAFVDLTREGGRLAGLPCIASDSVGTNVVMLDAARTLIADNGEGSIEVSRQASVQMDDAPTNNAATGTGSSLVSMFQTDSVALRAERIVNWSVLPGAAQFIGDADYLGVGSPA